VKVRLARKGVSIDQGLQRFIRDELSSTLQSLSGRVRWVRSLLEDTNGPRGGSDKRCVVSVAGDTLETRVVDVRDTHVRGTPVRRIRLGHPTPAAARSRGRLESLRPTRSDFVKATTGRRSS